MSKKKSTKTKSKRMKKASFDYNELSVAEGWSAVQAKVAAQDKIRMARHFATHDLFVQEEQSPGDDRKITSAKIIVNPGTAPNEVVKQVLEWVKTEVENNPNRTGVPYITWYTAGSLVPATLLDFKVTHPVVRNACGLYMFPGIVDPSLEMVRGQEAVRFVQQLEICFTYSLLSAYAFDMNTGIVFFFFDDEVELQQAIALLQAEHKFLFLDPWKLKSEGTKAYSIRELLETSRSVTIYTVSSRKDTTIREEFSNLTKLLLDTKNKTGRHCKTLRLVIVSEEKQVNLPVTGELKNESGGQTNRVTGN
jgi:hypothetical protein